MIPDYSAAMMGKVKGETGIKNAKTKKRGKD
jgi:hypothetical protein